MSCVHDHCLDTCRTGLRDECCVLCLRAALDAANAKIARVRALHTVDSPKCFVCMNEDPCETIRALDEPEAAT